MTTRKFDFATENYLKIGALYLEEAPLRSALSTSSQQSYYSIKQFWVTQYQKGHIKRRKKSTTQLAWTLCKKIINQGTKCHEGMKTRTVWHPEHTIPTTATMVVAASCCADIYVQQDVGSWWEGG